MSKKKNPTPPPQVKTITATTTVPEYTAAIEQILHQAFDHYLGGRPKEQKDFRNGKKSITASEDFTTVIKHFVTTHLKFDKDLGDLGMHFKQHIDALLTAKGNAIVLNNMLTSEFTYDKKSETTRLVGTQTTHLTRLLSQPTAFIGAMGLIAKQQQNTKIIQQDAQRIREKFSLLLQVPVDEEPTQYPTALADAIAAELTTRYPYAIPVKEDAAQVVTLLLELLPKEIKPGTEASVATQLIDTISDTLASLEATNKELFASVLQTTLGQTYIVAEEKTAFLASYQTLSLSSSSSSVEAKTHASSSAPRPRSHSTSSERSFSSGDESPRLYTDKVASRHARSSSVSSSDGAPSDSEEEKQTPRTRREDTYSRTESLKKLAKDKEASPLSKQKSTIIHRPNSNNGKPSGPGV